MEEVKPYYPTEWMDDQTMDVLFSPFRDNRDVNPQSWDRKMKFWTEMIYDECRFSKCPVVNLISLPHRFVRKGKTPVCLETVLLELQRHGRTQPVGEFRAAAGNTGWLSWGVNTFIKRPLSFSFRSARQLMGWQGVAGDQVLTDVIKEQADALLGFQARRTAGEQLDVMSQVVAMEKLMGEGSVCKEEETLELVLLQLIKDKRVAVSYAHPESQTRVVRFQAENEKQVKGISELELQALKLKDTSTRLLTQIEEIASEMERCRNDAKFYLGKGLRNSAKNALRRKKMLETLMTKRQSALENIDGLLQRINNAESDKMVLDAYADGTKAYKNMVSSMGLTPDNIDNIMDDVQEAFDVQEEINDSIQQGPKDPSMDVTTTDLEAELEAILSGGGAGDPEEALNDEQLKDITEGFSGLAMSHTTTSLDFPPVPTFDPSTPPKVLPVPLVTSGPRQSSDVTSPPGRLQQPLATS